MKKFILTFAVIFSITLAAQVPDKPLSSNTEHDAKAN